MAEPSFWIVAVHVAEVEDNVAMVGAVIVGRADRVVNESCWP